MSVDTSKLDKETKRQYWFDVISNFEQSGVRLKEYCSQNNLKYDHMVYYLQQYKKTQGEQSGETDFIPVELDTVINSQYVVKVDNSIEVKLPSSSGINQVVALIAALRKS